MTTGGRTSGERHSVEQGFSAELAARQQPAQAERGDQTHDEGHRRDPDRAPHGGGDVHGDGRCGGGYGGGCGRGHESVSAVDRHRGVIDERLVDGLRLGPCGARARQSHRIEDGTVQARIDGEVCRQLGRGERVASVDHSGIDGAAVGVSQRGACGGAQHQAVGHGILKAHLGECGGGVLLERNAGAPTPMRSSVARSVRCEMGSSSRLTTARRLLSRVMTASRSTIPAVMSVSIH